MSIPVAIVSPIPALRAGLSALLAADSTLALSVFASLPGSEALGSAPGVLVYTPGALENGDLSAIEGWAALLVGEEVDEIRALAGGRAWGILSSSATPEALLAAVRALAEGLSAATPELLERLIAPAAETPAGRTRLSVQQALEQENRPAGSLPGEPDEAPPENLTAREIDVLRLAAQGLTNKQIAYELKISEHTVKFHISAVFAKLQVSNRAEAVRKGARWGWVPL